MAAMKKKSVKKKSVNKKTAGKSPCKQKLSVSISHDHKLGHDPLAWLSGEEIQSLSKINDTVDPMTFKETKIENEKIHVPGIEAEKNIDQPVALEEMTKDIDDVKASETGSLPGDEDKTQRTNEDDDMLILPEIFGIAQAEDMHGELSSLLAVSGDIEIDASTIETLDASALQLLIAFIKECKSSGRNVIWKKSSAKIDSAASLLNIGTLLEL